MKIKSDLVGKRHSFDVWVPYASASHEATLVIRAVLQRSMEMQSGAEQAHSRTHCQAARTPSDPSTTWAVRTTGREEALEATQWIFLKSITYPKYVRMEHLNGTFTASGFGSGNPHFIGG